MSEPADAQVAEAVTTPDQAAETTVSTAAPDVSGETDEAAIEAEALAMGWKPQSSFKGPADKFVSAAEYIERGKTIMPFLRKELMRRDREIEGLKKAVETSIQHISRADQRAYAKAKADLEAELQQYAAAGNAAAVKEVTDDLITLEKEHLAPAKAKEGPPPEFVDWMDANPWYGKDRAMTAACDAIGAEVFDEGISGPAQIKEVDRRLREMFPTKFAKAENPNRRLPGAVEGAGGGPRPRGKTYADLPSDARAMCDFYVSSIKGFTKEKFLKDYDWS